MTTDSIQVTAEEIAQFRTELADNPRAIAALDAIEDCEGYLEDAVPLLLIEAGTEPDRSIGDLFEKCRQFICQEEVREALESGMIAPAIELEFRLKNQTVKSSLIIRTHKKKT